jgi:hypothetical protein
MVAVTELCEQLDGVGALDAAVGPIKQRTRGQSAGGLLVGWPAQDAKCPAVGNRLMSGH